MAGSKKKRVTTKKGVALRKPKKSSTTKKQQAAKREEVEMKPDKIGQSWSIDLIIGVIIFMLIVAIFYAFISAKSKPEFEGLQEDARSVIAKVETNDAYGLIKNGEVDQARLDELCNMPYDELKATLGIESDVCIFLEDQNGNVITCGTGNKAGIGNGEDLQISSSYRCGETTS